MERAVAARRRLLAAVAGGLAAQHASLAMNIARLAGYLAGGLLVAILLQSLALWLRLSELSQEKPSGLR